jgi:hypothetical protein
MRGANEADAGTPRPAVSPPLNRGRARGQLWPLAICMVRTFMGCVSPRNVREEAFIAPMDRAC